MSTIALFHSVLGVRAGVTDLATALEAAGHDVRIVDQYDGRVFDDYDSAMAFSEELGMQALIASALAGVADLPDGFVVAGFSNGGVAAEVVALNRAASKAVLLHAAIPVSFLESGDWPEGVPVQIHYSIDDPWRDEGGPEALFTDVVASKGDVEFYQYTGSGHLFSDPSLPNEYNADHARLMTGRVLRFLA